MAETTVTPGPAERLARRDQAVVLGAAGLLVLLAGLYTVFGIGMNMTALEMTRMARPIAEPMQMGPGPVWTPAYAVLVFAMWWVMMIAMMTPSAAPTLLLFTAVKRVGPEAATARSLSGWFLAGYLVAWAVFSLIATALQWGLEAISLSDGPMMTLSSRPLAAAVLVAAGLYQLSPLKSACLAKCRAPAGFLAEHHRPGRAGAFRMGAHHGTYCLGCCWALMALLFVGGIMNLYWIVGLALFVLAEKALPGGETLGRVAGAGLIGLGVAVFTGAL